MYKLTDFSYIFLTILFTVYGQVVMKWRMSNLQVQLPPNFTEKIVVLVKLLFDPFIFSGMVLAFLASLTWMAAMTKFELSFAYPFMALNFVLVFLLGIFVLGEGFSLTRMAGVVLIVVGTLVITRS
jgi:undecaprenyl phosphate-alpha-L-ara4N flippase subunit ArnF